MKKSKFTEEQILFALKQGNAGQSVSDGCRQMLRGRPVAMMNNTVWQAARVRAGLPQVRVHDSKHTFGRRLRAAGVSFEDRQDLPGHRSGRITTHYSGAELANLIEAANKVCGENFRKIPAPVLLKQNAAAGAAMAR